MCDKVGDKAERRRQGGALGYLTRQPVNPLDNVDDNARLGLALALEIGIDCAYPDVTALIA